ncbi:hypothetical protein [Methanoculleus sp.]|jgi:hypothetical protein|uniref:hypothetical protein n=1 Tax=Methanoculleus sp. TaxID=90427 RepID=UPI0025D6CD78|nr:hypothetical protein [Methanoculleus sp.]MCK9320152.1 hypothetical protein [Methanoculleus sp.]
MPRKTTAPQAEKTEEKVATPVEAPVEAPQEVKPDTPAKAEYRRMIEVYRLQNPTKYEQKKEQFERNLKGDITISTDKMNKRKTFIFTNVPPKE